MVPALKDILTTMVEIMRFDKSTDWPSYIRANVASNPDPTIQSLLRKMQEGDEAAGRQLMKLVVAQEFNGQCCGVREVALHTSW